MQTQKQLIVIGGATATGKTAAAIQVAQRFGAEILSADSRQFYREMSIGTAKPTAEELAQAPHHFIDSLSVTQDYSVGDFEADALALLRKIYEKSDVQDLMQWFENEGIAPLQDELRRLDPVYHGQVDLQNPHRLIRALSVCRASGQPFSAFRLQEKKQRFFTPIYLLLDVERPVLYEKINHRVDQMMQLGLLEEARALYPQRHLNALQTVGYQELFDFFDGKCSLEVAVENIKQNSRRYAKRQSTWFRKDPHWNRFDPGDVEGMMTFLAGAVNGSYPSL
ncbi:MAG: tRNA (adenosine(37)-N6)-dimethylallyltransferase MiaA [Saprospiraceae bacterium]|nr:tRNA (adenosine(37)-N6)-dimethylallyltransferase MiaA [Saprospiraceae bacterium]